MILPHTQKQSIYLQINSKNVTLILLLSTYMIYLTGTICLYPAIVPASTNGSACAPITKTMAWGNSLTSRAGTTRTSLTPICYSMHRQWITLAALMIRRLHLCSTFLLILLFSCIRLVVKITWLSVRRCGSTSLIISRDFQPSNNTVVTITF